jgi:hypothetical protein
MYRSQTLLSISTCAAHTEGDYDDDDYINDDYSQDQDVENVNGNVNEEDAIVGLLQRVGISSEAVAKAGIGRRRRRARQRQGLTLAHFSAQRKHFAWARGSM